MIALLGRRPLLATMLAVSAHAAAQGEAKPAPSCRDAVEQSRMICITGSNCQKEISRILQACRVSNPSPACTTAREDLRTQCGHPAPFDSTRNCNAALKQVSEYCRSAENGKN